MTIRAFFQEVEIRQVMERAMSPEEYATWLKGQALFHSIRLAKKGARDDAALTIHYAEMYRKAVAADHACEEEAMNAPTST